MGFAGIRANFLISAVLRTIAAVAFLFFLSEVVDRREHVPPSYVFSEMLRYGVRGGIKDIYHAAGVVKRTAKRAEDGVSNTTDKATLTSKKIMLEFNDVVARIGHRTDVMASRIIEGEKELEQKATNASALRDSEHTGRQQERP
jgi:hypothetical protein